MSLVNADTGEIVASVTADEAREITDRIKVTVEGAWILIKQAYETRCWAALGYQSWDDYCTREFGTSRLKLPREERQEVVASLRDSGLSIRAIAAATGHDAKTIQRDLQSGVGNAHTSEPVTGTDGKTYKPSTAERIKAAAKNNPASDKVERARKMAAEGYTSRQIGEAIGITDMGGFRERHGIDVPADAVVGKPKRHDPNRILEETATTLEGLAMGIALVDVKALDRSRVDAWSASIAQSMTQFRTLLKEMTR